MTQRIGRGTFRKPHAPFRRDLGLQLLAIYLLFVGPVMLAGVIFDGLSSARLQEDVRSADLSLARAIALETDAKLADAIHTVEVLAEQPAVIEANDNGMLPLFEAIAAARPDVNLIYRLAPDGTMLFHYPLGPGSTVGVDFSFRDYFQDARRSSHAVISKGRISPTTEQAVATTVMPIRNKSGAFQGVVATNIRLQSLSETFSAIAEEYEPSERFQVSIVDATGQIIADANPEQLLKTASEQYPEVVRDSLLGRESSRTADDPQGVEWLSTYVPIHTGGWGVVVRRPTAVAFATAYSFHRGLLVALAIFLLGGVLFWLALSRRVILPLERLTAFSRSLAGAPDADMLPPAGLEAMARRPDQMGHLVRSMTRLRVSIQERMRELSTLLETSKAVVSSLEAGTVLDRILDQTSRLVGADTCAIVMLDTGTNEFRIQASRGLSDNYIRHLRIDPAEPNSPSMRAIRSGHPIVVSDTETDPTYPLFRPRARAEGYRALLVAPLVTPHAPPAALIVYYREPHAFDDREIDLVWNFANHAAMAIENATLFARSDEQLQEQTRRLEALIQSLEDGLILEDLAGNVLYCNRKVCEWAGLTLEAARAQNAERLRGMLGMPTTPNPSAGGTQEETRLGVEWVLAESTPPRTLRLQAFQVTDSHGDLIGRGQIIQDVTHDRELERMKDSLIATVSHELRTPLASIKGYATTLLAEDVDWDAGSQREFLHVISQETDRLSDLVTDLLDLSRIEAGSLTVNRSRVLLPDIIHRAAQHARPSPASRLTIQVDENLPTLAVDGRKIESVVRNLLENAARYANPDAPILVRAEKSDGHVIVRVEDQGPGIPEEYAERVFEPFVRLGEGFSKVGSGAGLGLSICRGFVQAHGGEIWLEPKTDGARVAFSLPLESDPSDD